MLLEINFSITENSLKIQKLFINFKKNVDKSFFLWYNVSIKCFTYNTFYKVYEKRRILIMKKIALLMAVIAMALSVTACGKKCAVCGESNMFGNEEVMGMTVCGDCMDDARALGGL